MALPCTLCALVIRLLHSHSTIRLTFCISVDIRVSVTTHSKTQKKKCERCQLSRSRMAAATSSGLIQCHNKIVAGSTVHIWHCNALRHLF